MIRVHIPMPLRYRCAGKAELEVRAEDVKSLLGELEKHHTDLYRGVCDDTGAVRRHVNVFVNQDHIRDRAGMNTRLEPGDMVIIMPAVSGG